MHPSGNWIVSRNTSSDEQTEVNYVTVLYPSFSIHASNPSPLLFPLAPPALSTPSPHPSPSSIHLYSSSIYP